MAKKHIRRLCLNTESIKRNRRKVLQVTRHYYLRTGDHGGNHDMPILRIVRRGTDKRFIAGDGGLGELCFHHMHQSLCLIGVGSSSSKQVAAHFFQYLITPVEPVEASIRCTQQRVTDASRKDHFSIKEGHNRTMSVRTYADGIRKGSLG